MNAAGEPGALFVAAWNPPPRMPVITPTTTMRVFAESFS